MIDNMVCYSLFANSYYSFEYGVTILQDVRTRKSRYRPAFSIHKIVADLILRIIDMLAAIKLNHQL